MTIHDDRNPNRPLPDDTSMDRAINAKRHADAGAWSMTSLFLGGLAALAVIFGIFFMMSGPSQNTAGRVDPSAQPRSETTGSAPTAPAQNRPAAPAQPAR